MTNAATAPSSEDESTRGHTTEDILLRKRRLRRERKKQMQSLYRETKKREGDALQETHDQLEQALRDLRLAVQTERQRGSLPWKDIAAALSADNDAAHDCNMRLKVQLANVQTLVRAMHAWVTTPRTVRFALLFHFVSSSSQAIPLATSWRDVTLPFDPAARLLGKKWIATRMYHHTDRVFHDHGLARRGAASDDFSSSSVEFTDHGVEYTMCHEFVVPGPRDVVAEGFRQSTCATFMMNMLFPITTSTAKEVTASTTLHQMVSQTGDHVNVLAAEFRDADRVVVVVQQIHHDDLWPHNHMQRDRSIWMELTRASAHETAIRVVYRMAGRRNADGGPVPFATEALVSGCDLSHVPKAMHESMFRQHIQELMPLAQARTRQIFQVPPLVSQ
ncbi:Aste57867_14224 [Aphanomyces stellatus]|uniref:Aste57867_14224 protein n=1 Tax=Aphanomyces stellatus TaxID=120398 RepID=A0A485L066_9STRA|nr:hypothetical protein As57867_014173 [Aphanomyces stellatus]VFT91049.1 Aste57867_14224 [Aphanomyces stellatus]